MSDPRRMVGFVVPGPDGEIGRHGQCADVDLELQGGAIEGFGTPETHYVLNGEVVAYTAAQAAAKQSPPTQWHKWSNSTFDWTETRSAADIAAQLAAGARARRDALLAASDFTQLADSPAPRGPWVAYRQALRDLTKQPGFPGSVTWPDPPAVSAG